MLLEPIVHVITKSCDVIRLAHTLDATLSLETQCNSCLLLGNGLVCTSTIYIVLPTQGLLIDPSFFILYKLDSVAQRYRASDSRSEGCVFESPRDQITFLLNKLFNACTGQMGTKRKTL